MPATIINRSAYAYSSGDETVYTLSRNGATYYVYATSRGVYIAQRYTKRNGTTGQRRLAHGKLHEELQSDLKAALLRERLCTPMTVGQASISAALVF